MVRLLPWLLLAACAPKAPRIPGPLAAVGREASTVHTPPPSPSQLEPGRHKVKRKPDEDAVVAAAKYYLDHSMRGFRDDCSGFVMAVYAKVGRPVAGNTASFYSQAKEAGALHHRKLPRPGDLAFFDDTYDRNHNGRLDDELSHVAIVIEVKDDGTVVMAHGGTSRGRTTLQMNLQHPEVRHAEGGVVYNDWLRVKRDSDPAGTRYLAGELWSGFASFQSDWTDAAADPEKE
jgi:surface antigen